MDTVKLQTDAGKSGTTTTRPGVRTISCPAQIRAELHPHAVASTPFRYFVTSCVFTYNVCSQACAMSILGYFTI